MLPPRRATGLLGLEYAFVVWRYFVARTRAGRKGPCVQGTYDHLSRPPAKWEHPQKDLIEGEVRATRGHNLIKQAADVV